MGCFNTSGCLSQLPIIGGQEVVCFIGVYNVKSEETSMVVDVNGLISPYTLPVYGVYNDYGSIESVVHDTNVEIIERYFGRNIEEIFQIAHRFASQSISASIAKLKEKIEEDKDNEFRKEELSELEAISPLFKNVWQDPRYNDFRFKLCFEHRRIWDSLVENAFDFSKKAIEKEDHRFWWEKETMDLNAFYTFIEKYEAVYKEADEHDKKYLDYKYPNIFSTESSDWRMLTVDLNYTLPFTKDLITKEDVKNIQGYFTSEHNECFMALYSQIQFEDKSRFYRECRAEIEKYQRLCAYLNSIPMTFVFSCEGLQDFNLKSYCEVIDVIRDSAIAIRNEYEEEYGEELEDE